MQPRQPRRAQALFFDAAGSGVSSHSFELAAGQSTAGSAFPPCPTKAGAVFHLRAVVSLQRPPVGERSSCKL